jgi:hypothetical protein
MNTSGEKRESLAQVIHDESTAWTILGRNSVDFKDGIADRSLPIGQLGLKLFADRAMFRSIEQVRQFVRIFFEVVQFIELIREMVPH